MTGIQKCPTFWPTLVPWVFPSSLVWALGSDVKILPYLGNWLLPQGVPQVQGVTHPVYLYINCLKLTS